MLPKTKPPSRATKIREPIPETGRPRTQLQAVCAGRRTRSLPRAFEGGECPVNVEVCWPG
jgi:hypothetical protein